MRACPSELDLARALTTGADEAIVAHLASCGSCRETWQRDEEAIRIVRDLPAEVPPLAHREEVRTSFLAEASARGPARSERRPAIRWLAGVAIAAAGALYVVTSGATAHHAHGTVHPRAGAHFESAHDVPDEIVRLHEGTIDVDVEPLGSGERFRVIVGDAEIEVRGTSFTMTAESERLVSVRVVHGRVEVRTLDGETAVVQSGQAWTRPSALAVPSAPPASAAAPPAAAPTTVTATSAVPTPTPTPQRHTRLVVRAPTAESTAPASSPTAPSAVARPPEEVAYNEGWDAIRVGAFHRAASAFARSLALSPTGALADDARYWHAVALARDSRTAEAISAFREYLDESAAATHRGEASTMLGWLLVDTRELAEAERRFRAAQDDPDPAVRASARAGVAAVAVPGE